MLEEDDETADDKVLEVPTKISINAGGVKRHQ